ncbi:HET-domain-containing protein, partial [Dissoconium aciculare CBS 342.82]|uniref:HET-domain-containing protein n=1 Tax=Dissoconium aciculare CBS 342.82 TaxID=1314786 RepID=A0A6J3MFX5_9PEZI
MRLLQQNENGDLSFTDNTYNPPPYAILSHTWGSPNDEVLYDDIMNGTWREKDAHVKLNFISERAKRERLQHFWVDTCCIDKRNDAELSTAIRSMFQWYKDSAVCFVYLSDISSSKRNEDGQLLWRENLRFCRWFTRGWTLQELVAPIRVEFFARGQYLGCRADLSERIHEITGIDVEALRGRPLEKFPLFTRRQWALGRETSVPEDSAYALMGLCGVVLVPHYGGESKEEALRRLDRKIRKHWGENALDRPASAVASDYISDYTAPNSKSVATRRRAKIAALGFDAIDSRKTTIKKAQWRTCSWVLTHQTYKLWQERSIAQPHNGIFWIRGKPGAGKSVLMKYIDTHTSRTKNQRDISISFYFNARGERLEQSLDGMYRSLLRQLLLADPELQEVLDHSREITGESSSTTTELKRLFSGAVLRLTGRRLFCFIDALDECREQDLQDMVYYFQELWKEAQEEGIIFSVCFASRYYPSLDVPTELQIILEHVDEHKNDLSEYVKSQKFSVGMGGLESIPLGIQEQILEKANGVFLLAVLAVEVLKEEFKSGRIHVIRKRLDEMPRGLSEFFQEIVQRDQQNTEEFLLCLKWILFAKQPLTLEQFYFAMMAGLAGESLESKSDLTADTMLSYLLSSSKGLAELTQGTRPRVQFIHESVRNFLI